jgi:hypothetical protein
MSRPVKFIKDTAYWVPRTLLFAVVAFYLALTVLLNFDSMEPYLYPLHSLRGTVRSEGEFLLIGPYPHSGELKALRNRNDVSVVVSLLDTGLPQEESLNRREREVAERLGLLFRNFPMGYLPVNSEANRRQAEALRAFVRENRGRRIYMNCYLGRHRVEFARRALARKE